ncbi:MAG: tetratricopeptide repeat protein [Ignavibacteriales bacterium]|nr:tetratricopeptide repeat protein [Ignavibacteriales bacterium]
MLKPKKRISKKEIKEDRLVTSYFEATSWYETNKKIVNGVLAGVVVLAILIVAYVNNVTSNNQKATTELGKVLPYYDQGKYDLAINGNLQENIRGFQSIVDDYGSTKAGELAGFYLANCYFAQGDYDKALKYYLNVSVKDDLISASSLAGAGACYEANGDHAKAASSYEKAAFMSAKDVNVPENMFHAAQNHILAGNKEKAVELLKKVKKDYPNASVTRDIDRWIAIASV